MKRIVYKTALMISLSSVAAAGCTADSVDRTLPVQEECFVETNEAVGQEDLGMAEAGMNGRIKRFIPSAEYEETGGNVLTQQEAEAMQEKEFVIQAESFVSYDSERRIGTRDDREPVSEESMIKEYRDDRNSVYIWRPAAPDTLLRESRPDERLREAVGEAYYNKINGMFINFYLGWQQFYTLDGGGELIMHSMLTGQDYILEKNSGKR